jgi:hypothetical protein
MHPHYHCLSGGGLEGFVQYSFIVVRT